MPQYIQVNMLGGKTDVYFILWSRKYWTILYTFYLTTVNLTSSQAEVLRVFAQNSQEEDADSDGGKRGSWKWTSHKNTDDDYIWY